MLRVLCTTHNLTDPFEACIWAMALCAFWGMMSFGEVSVTTCNTFSPTKHLTRKDARFSVDLDGRPYAGLDLPSLKTAKPGEIQSVFLVPQDGLCPLSEVGQNSPSRPG